MFGNDNDVLSIVTPADIYNDPFNSGWNASGINSALFGFFPDLADDSFATIGWMALQPPPELQAQKIHLWCRTRH